MIPANDLKRGFLLHKKEYEEKAFEVLNSGWYVLGREVEAFEKEFANSLGTKYGIGVDNGLNAIALGIRALGIGSGDEVIVQANTYIATALGVSHNGAKPVFVDCDEHFGVDVSKISEKINLHTKAVLVTHLYGMPNQMDELVRLCRQHNLHLLEDCAQSHFATFCGKCTGTFGIMGFFSFYPTKNLGAFGDGGAIVTDSAELAENLKCMRNYGSKVKYMNECIGYNSRLDEIQAGLLRVKLSHMQELNDERQCIAETYLSGINNPKIILPRVREKSTCIWHQFVVRTQERDRLKEYLKENGIGSDIHYPIPPHLSAAYKTLAYKKGDFPIAEEYANTVISLPMFNGMTDGEIKQVIECINKF